MYFVGYSKWMLIGGRLVAGVGLGNSINYKYESNYVFLKSNFNILVGVVATCFSEIVKTTNNEERGKILARIMMGRQIGLIIGPSANFLLYNINVKIGPFLLNNLSAPGLLMAVLWALMEIFILLFYKNLNEFNEISIAPIQPVSSNSQTIINTNDDDYNETTNLLSPNDNEAYESFRRFTETDTSRTIRSGGAINTSDASTERVLIIDNSQTGPLLVRLYNEYIREEVVAVLSITFTVFFMQTALETLITPITRELFNWTDKENSILYACCGVEILLVFLILSFLTKCISERVLLLTGLIGNLLTLIFLLVYLPMAKVGAKDAVSIILFILPVFGNVFSLPLIALGSISSLSKITSMHTQGQTQGIRRAVVGISTIFGPIWTGVFYGSWRLLFGSLIALVSLSLIMLILSFKWLKPTNRR